MNVRIRCRECDCLLGEDIEFAPDRPAPPCMNPDSPAYSDSGDPGYLEGYPESCPNCGWKVDEDWAYDAAREAFYDKVDEAREREAENKMDDMLERRGRRW